MHAMYYMQESAMVFKYYKCMCESPKKHILRVHNSDDPEDTGVSVCIPWSSNNCMAMTRQTTNC